MASTRPHPHIHFALPRSSLSRRRPPFSSSPYLSPFVSICNRESQGSKPVSVLFNNKREAAFWEPRLGTRAGKSLNAGPGLGIRRGLQNWAVLGFSAAAFLFKVHFPLGSCHIDVLGGHTAVTGRTVVVVPGSALPARQAQATAVLLRGLWEGPFLLGPDVCLLEALSPAGGANQLRRLASIPLEMRAQCLHRT